MISRHHRSPFQGPLEGDRLTATDWWFYDKINSKLIEKDHGVLGALMLAHQLAIREGFMRTKQRIYGDFLYNHLPACHAISLHHLPSVPIEFSKHPLAFLLVLCDELQDWGRPSNQTNQDIICLNDINITDSNPPEIQFVTKISDNRKKRLKKALSNRLYSGKIKIVVMNTKKEVIFRGHARPPQPN